MTIVPSRRIETSLRQNASTRFMTDPLGETI